MEKTRFGEQATGPRSDASRRRVLGGLVGATVALLSGATVLEAKKGANTGKGKGKSKAHGKNKVAICHFDEETGLYSYKEVPSPALKGHAKHGDVVEGVTSADDCAALNVDPEPEPEA